MPTRNHTSTESTILILCLIGIYFLPVSTTKVAASIHSPWWTHLMCHFFHANLFHLISNLWALWLIRPSLRFMAVAYLLSIPATFVAFHPVVGISSVIYTLLAFQIIETRIPWKHLGLFFGLNLATAFIPSIAFLVHMTAFGIGITYIIIMRQIHEYRRAMQGR